jgi:hypothetical protein
MAVTTAAFEKRRGGGERMKKVLLVLCVVALLALTSAAYATESNWLISVKAVSPAFLNAGTAINLGVGTAASTANASFPTTAQSTAQGEKTGSDTGYHNKHQYAQDTDGDVLYSWDLKIGAKSDATYSTINICLYNNAEPQLNTTNQVLDLALGYAFFDGQDLAAWFSTAGNKDAIVAQKGYAAADTAKWFDVSVLLKAKGWNPTAASTGWYYTDTATKGTNFDSLGSYSFQAFSVVTPEPGSLMAMGSGLIGLAGFAIRRRK